MPSIRVRSCAIALDDFSIDAIDSMAWLASFALLAPEPTDSLSAEIVRKVVSMEFACVRV
jgi:hypothetical protein